MCLSFSRSSPPSVPPRAPFNKSKMREGIDEKSHKTRGLVDTDEECVREGFTLTLALASQDMNVNRESHKYCQ